MYLCQHPVIPLNKTKAQSLLPRFAPPTKHAPFFFSSFSHVVCRQRIHGRRFIPVCANSDFNYPPWHAHSRQHHLWKVLHCFIDLLALKSHDIESALSSSEILTSFVYLDGAGNCGQRQQNLDISVWPARLSLRLPTVF